MYELRQIFDPEKVKPLLLQNNLKPLTKTDCTLGLFDKEKLAATGSLAGNIVEGLAVESNYREDSLTNKIVSELISIAQEKGIYHLFLFTKPENKEKIESLGFKFVGRGNERVVLLEFGVSGIEEYKTKLLKYKKSSGPAGAIVINANPLTRGHLYLIQTALTLCGELYLFVVEENRSLFPFETRFSLIEQETRGFGNLTLIPSGKYIISDATFPSYFLKEEELAPAQASLDIDIFIRHIAPTLGIRRRFAGKEPYSAVTNIYNETMKKMLPPAGIDFFELERISLGGDFISASRVRKLFEEKKLSELKELVPPATFAFLASKEGERVLIEHEKKNR